MGGDLDRDPGHDEVLLAILWRLLPPRAAETIDDYEPAPRVIARWLDHMDHRGDTVHDFLTIEAIRRFCDQGQGWPTRIEDGLWTTEQHAAVLAHTTALLNDDRWVPLVETDLDAEDGTTFKRADMAAATLGIDTFDRLLARRYLDPLLPFQWHRAWDQAHHDPARVRALVDLARNLPDPDNHRSVNNLLAITINALGDHPGVGADLVTTGLQRHSDTLHYAALGTLEAWGTTHIDHEQLHLIRAIANKPEDRPRRRPGSRPVQRPPAWARALLERIDSGT